jgi:threonine-phosphate decarboxylase
MIVGHGGNVHEAARTIGCRASEIIDMSSNVNPLGPMPELVDTLTDKLAEMTVLPDAAARLPVQHFAAYHRLDPDRVLAGNGTTQFIYTLPRALAIERALILGPTYADYADACTLWGVPVETLPADPRRGFEPDLDRLDRQADDYDTIFICNPNNPTGRLIPGARLGDLCRNHPRTRFVVDESYLPFVIDGETHSLIESHLQNVIVLHSLSKIFRIPGLRIGFLIAPPTSVHALQPYMLPWSVNSLAQAAVAYLMTHSDEVARFVAQSRRHVQRERERVIREFADHALIRFFNSDTVFILGHLRGPQTAADIQTCLLREKILIRNCENFNGLSDRYIRISLKTPDVNVRLAQILNRCLTERV